MSNIVAVPGTQPAVVEPSQDNRPAVAGAVADNQLEAVIGGGQTVNTATCLANTQSVNTAVYIELF